MTDTLPEILIDDERWDSILKDVDMRAIIDRTKTQNDEFSVLFTDDAKLQQLNNDFRHKNKPTNVLSFPSDSEDYLGDIAIAYETVEREATEQNKQLSHHVTHMLIHGILHLLGYDHETDEEAAEMEAIEIKILEDMGIKNPYI